MLGQCRVAPLGKGLPFPSACALPWPNSGTLSITELPAWPTSLEPSDNDQMSSSSTPRSWRFAYLLAAFLLLIALHPFFVGTVWEPLLLDFFLPLVIFAIVYAVSRSTTTLMVAVILALPMLGGRWVIHCFPLDALTLVALAAGVAFVAFVVVRILLYVLRQMTVTLDTVSALSVYLLFGLGWE